MSKKEHIEKNAKSQVDTPVTEAEEQNPSNNASQTAGEAEETPEQDAQQRIEELEAKVKELEDIKLRQMAEFDNYRRRTQKEKLELMESAGERIFRDMLPLIDDMERATQAVNKYEDMEALKQGVELINQKFQEFLAQNKVTTIPTEDTDFNTDEHEAVTLFAAGEEKKGKIIDCVQKGYKLGEKVIRFAKVVVGE